MGQQASVQASLYSKDFSQLRCAGASVLVDATGFDLAPLDTAMWKDVLDAASVANDFAF